MKVTKPEVRLPFLNLQITREIRHAHTTILPKHAYISIQAAIETCTSTPSHNKPGTLTPPASFKADDSDFFRYNEQVLFVWEFYCFGSNLLVKWFVQFRAGPVRNDENATFIGIPSRRSRTSALRDEQSIWARQRSQKS